ncbi:universal stress protein [Noviherbaspirillum autotrophicum]|uniref:UspA domain-containing protein n=1 Tax=Noviherbaspirillum autotrophicum TaxID=709839 RepID=A0A0C2BR15_9BURK|nr:universal stress protein [Noviherbaspirillum autotrophicum]KIF82514.1 hypothetical protein TSA66_19565 [Noviherbaspirillum autotrophicum]
MYKHILLPTDGSELSEKAIASGVLLAKNIGATVVGVYVVTEPRQDQLEAWLHHDPHYAERRAALFEKFADEYLSFVSNSALAEEVPCTCKLVRASEPYQGIVDTAERSGCDLIIMASHGWKGDASQLLGSETIRVLVHSKVPVLVHKPGADSGT